MLYLPFCTRDLIHVPPFDTDDDTEPLPALPRRSSTLQGTVSAGAPAERVKGVRFGSPDHQDRPSKEGVPLAKRRSKNTAHVGVDRGVFQHVQGCHSLEQHLIHCALQSPIRQPLPYCLLLSSHQSYAVALLHFVLNVFPITSALSTLCLEPRHTNSSSIRSIRRTTLCGSGCTLVCAHVSPYHLTAGML